jgi:hypothetical protein
MAVILCAMLKFILGFADERAPRMIGHIQIKFMNIMTLPPASLVKKMKAEIADENQHRECGCQDGKGRHNQEI